MVGEVFEVLDVECGEREVQGEAAGGYPGVVGRPWAAALDGASGDSTPGSCDGVVAVDDADTIQPRGEGRATPGSPVS